MTLIAAAGLAACAPDQPERPPGHTPNHHPVFASDEEALAAAEDAFGAYLEVANLVAQESGVEPERFSSVTTHGWLEVEIEAAKALHQTGNHQVGDVKFSSLTLQQVEISGAQAIVDAYACLDVSGARFLDVNGVDVTPIDRDSTLPIQLTFRSLKQGLIDVAGDSAVLLLERSEPWTGQDFCL